MKKIILSIITAIAIPTLVLAFTFQDFTNLFKKQNLSEQNLKGQASFIVLTGSGDKYLKPVGALWGLQWAGLATSTTGCLSVNSSGWISPSGSSCGSLSGGSANALTYWTSGTTVGATTSPTVGYITATSTTATSTFAGGLKSDKAVQFPSFANCNIDTDTDGFLVCGSDSTGSGVGTVSTSTIPTIGNLAYWTSAGYPSLLGTIATSTPTMTAPLTYSGTLGSFVGGVAGTFDCTSATGSVKGCLTSADWTTFNNKQATISATWPITLSGAAVGFNGLSTSTAAVVGNLPYFSGVNTFANAATTTLTGTAPMVFSNPISVIGGSASVLTCVEASGSVAGCLSSANWTTFNGKQAGDATLTALAGLTISAGSLITGTGADAFSVLAGGTNGYVLAMSGSAPAWVATTTLSTISGTLDISAQSNLTAGTNITLTNDDLSVDDAFLLNTGDIGTGVYDFGGATSLELPNNGTVNANGEITTDDTSGQLRYYAGSAERVLVPIWSRGFTYATSSTFSATTTKPYLGQAPYALTITTAFCETDTGTLNVSVRDGAGNRLDLINASTTIGTFTFSANNTFTKGESIRVEVGTPATSPTLVSCTFIGTPTAD